MSWQDLESLFLEALQLPPEERATCLLKVTDDALRTEVEAMLEAHEGEGLTIETRLLASTAPPDLANQHVGPYRLLNIIGRGGMGEVYLARRDDDLYEREVAIKLVQFGPRPSLHERFARERSILARLTHPNVATLYDGGVHTDGRPYLVMEYVQGLPITEFCDQNRLDIRSRIELMIKVCEVVQFAHAALIIHRDLKASNILVDQEGTPKLLDFGIAKLLEEDEGETIGLDRVLTPEHAAPEQIRGEEPTTATDVYSLGVLLCELLSGKRPIEFPTHSPLEIDRIASEVEPEAPSRLVRTSSAVSRRTTGTQLRAQLKGELDAICAKALRKEPDRRYISASEMAADLRRYLRSQPVEAVRGSRAYFARKFVRRHRASLGLSAAAFLVITGFLAVTLVQAIQLRTERDRARKEFARAELVLDRLVSLFEEGQPRAVGEEDAMDVGEFLRRGEETAALLEDEPEARARMNQVLAKIYSNRGDLEHAVELTTEARELTSDEAEGLRLDQELALLRNRHEGPAVGIPLLRASLAAFRQALGSDHPDTRQAQIALGSALQDPVEARSLIEPELAATDLAPPTRAAALNALARVELGESRFEAARALLTEADSILSRTLPESSPRRIVVRHNLAAAYARLGLWEQAEPMQRELLAAGRRVFGRDTDATASALEGLAVTLANLGRHREAAECFAEALEIFERTLAPGHWRIANGERNVGQLLSLGGQYKEALPHLDRAIELGGGLHPRAQRALVWLGLGQTARATRELESIVSLMDDPASRTRTPYRADVRVFLGIALLHAGRADAARIRFREALDLRKQLFSADHPKVSEAECGLMAAGGPASPGASQRYRAWGLSHPLLHELLEP